MHALARGGWGLGFGLAWALAGAQGTPASPRTQRPVPGATAEAIVAQVAPSAAFTVRRHSLGADEVQLTFLNAEFPPQYVRQIAERVGQETGVPIRGLQVFRTPASAGNVRFVKASFATNGLLDPATGTVKLQPLARAMAGVPEPFTIPAFTVGVTGVNPTNRTLRTHVGEAAVVAGMYSGNPPGLEYRVVLMNQASSAIEIPDQFQPERSAPAQASSSGKPAWLVPALVGLAAIATGFLVYFVTLTLGRSPRRFRDR